MVEVEDRVSDILRKASGDMMLSTTQQAIRQWKLRLREAVKNGHNLAPIMTSLMMYEGEEDGANRVRIIEEGLYATEDGKWAKHGNLYVPATLKNSGATGNRIDQANRPPLSTGARGDDGNPKASPIRLLKGGRKQRAKVSRNPKERVHRYLDAHPTASLSDIEKGAKVSRDTAIKHRETWEPSTGTNG